ncbi:hypothetical protein O7626_30975 [Micromonospora sp. WMMD1102]|uniref:hypothetical protein n=1 Tax=Micromonospora sp. WMMD1102 TaxID=3016105 RepID=UPI002414EF9C|nr:hypothetical protein [Micromonospora sp. WMMD1102]MDG4790294.1 hypothetical protein [Micromonospora sp. WMMD1102]
MHTFDTPARRGGPTAVSREIGSWLERLRLFWSQRLDALAGELARREGERPEQHVTGADTAGTPDQPVNEENP